MIYLVGCLLIVFGGVSSAKNESTAGKEMQSATANSSQSLKIDKGGARMTTGDFKQISFQTIDGKPTNLAAYDGKVKLVVNVASKCGYTPQYAGLEKLYEKYKDQGFVVIGFPENNFKNQEPGTNAEIKKFCTSKYNVTFPMMSKISVKGEDIHPLYQYLTTHADPPGDISWNFNKFLLDRDGNIVARWESKVEPTSDTIVKEIEKTLGSEAKKD